MRMPRRSWIVALFTFLLAGCCKTQPSGGDGPLDPDALSIVAIDDEPDPFQEATNLPNGLSLERENAGWDTGRAEPRVYLRLQRNPAETLPDALKRVRPWLEKHPLPQGRRLGWAPVFAGPPSNDITGWRSYLLVGPVVVNGADVRRFEDVDDMTTGPSLLIELSDSGAKAFEALTRRHVKRRCAILVRGVVESAPVIQEPIAGGKLRLTAGGGYGTQRLRDALLGTQ
ncbi:MAG: SecDF P1 head subdomain-containing protein [Myxococcota bacterium]